MNSLLAASIAFQVIGFIYVMIILFIELFKEKVDKKLCHMALLVFFPFLSILAIGFTAGAA